MNLQKSILLLCLIATGLVMGCTTEKKEANKAIDPANMDLAYTPGQDFYHYANGNWLKNNPLPPEFVQYGAFTELREKNRKDLKALVLEAAAAEDATEGSIKRKIGDFYNSGMDTIGIDEAGLGPILPDLEAIDDAPDMAALQELMSTLQVKGVSPWFYIFSRTDPDNSDWVIANIWQGGLGLPDVDYYLNIDPRSKEIREKYVEHVSRMLQFTGQDKASADQDAVTIMDMETRLAKASMRRVEMRDPRKTRNKMDLAGLKKMVPSISWDDYFKKIGLEDPGTINVGQPGFFSELNAMLQDVPLEDWKKQMRWTIINRSANYLSSDIEKADFDFYNAFLSGQQEMQPRWKRVLSSTDAAMSEAIGQMYVKKHFPPEAKERMEVLVGNLKASLADRIKALDWMTEETKGKALEKLQAMRLKVGYPDKWKDYSKLEVKPDNYLANIRSTGAFYFREEMEKINKPVDREEWFLSPQTVNAGYVPTFNEIIFPAGILQPPFFFMDADDAVNYGAIGVVIGHEMTHGFDDKGRLFDLKGNLADWWTQEDAELFEDKSKVLVKHFNEYTVLDSLPINGELTLGENIADLGGLNIAYDGLMKALEGKNPDPIEGFTPEQRFFLSFAQLWRNHITDQELMRRLQEDVHSPGIARVNAALMNMDPFYEAFELKPGDELYLAEDKRAKIW